MQPRKIDLYLIISPIIQSNESFVLSLDGFVQLPPRLEHRGGFLRQEEQERDP